MRVKSTEEILNFLAPIAEQVGVEIIEVKWELRREHASLSLFIDAAGGVDLNLCEAFHRAVDVPLDELDPTFGAAYTLNCSSAGLDRPFKTERDYLRHTGEEIEVHLYAAQEGKKEYHGILRSYDGESVVLETKEGEKSFSLDKIAKACLYIEI